MNNKMVYVCLFIFLFTLVACANVSLNAATPTDMISSAAPTNIKSNVSTPYDSSAQATFDAVRASIAEEQESGMQQGNEIVVAIEKYYKGTNQYPDNLGELVPVYLNEIPLTITGEQFEYRLVEPQFYYLSFLLRRQAERFACTYMGDLRTWECRGTGH
jgi:hypothetical protein